MKTMTCQQLGGPCELQHHGATADEIIKAQDQHLKEIVKSGDVDHVEARKAMKARWRHPKQSLGWYNGVKERFAELPDTAAGAATDAP